LEGAALGVTHTGRRLFFCAARLLETDGETIFSVKEAAKLLNITERACWLRIYRNQLPHKRWGRRVLVSARELEKFIDGLPGLGAAEAIARVEGGSNER
jgi:excisionase family DNA binding protein